MKIHAARPRKNWIKIEDVNSRTPEKETGDIFLCPENWEESDLQRVLGIITPRKKSEYDISVISEKKLSILEITRLFNNNHPRQIEITKDMMRGFLDENKILLEARGIYIERNREINKRSRLK